ncbi:TetR family transcriptional regulator C-terminal domain-containing protein [Nocardioides sp. W7]|uniref:TetR/AcrR family transcriptional regulator n=1 Tax=Nocardioides sp. W7 TaxID=2931390 RepID=UPI001FD1E728|nr:TetR family transcriptional regulator C-terminal domain-containing protein [Nocardioides sp. W7]
MPAPVDHEARRADVAEAVWRVLARTGFDGLSLRAVATELGATTGLVTHYFPHREVLVRHALDLLHERSDARLAPLAAGLSGLEALRARLVGLVSDDDETMVLSRIWVSFWGPALADPDLRDREAVRYVRWRSVLGPLVVEALDRGELAPADPQAVVDVLTSCTHGLVVQVLVDPAAFPLARREAALDLVLASLAP